MKRDFEVHGIKFHIGNYTPRNEFDKGSKYELYTPRVWYDGSEKNISTGMIFSTMKKAKEYAAREWIRYDY